MKIVFPKTHDLLKLETLLLSYELEIKNYEKEIDVLNRYYIETRYPGDYPEFFWKEAEEAYASALHIKEFVINKINLL